MLGRLSKLIENRKRLSTNKALRFSFEDRSIQDFILQLNADEQLFNEGVDADGRIVGFYSRYTEEINRGKSFAGKQKKAGNRYFFYDTGKLFDSFFIRIDDDGVIIGNTDLEKLEDIMSDPTRLLGLTEESRATLIAEILPSIRDYILKILLG